MALSAVSCLLDFSSKYLLVLPPSVTAWWVTPALWTIAFTIATGDCLSSSASSLRALPVSRVVHVAVVSFSVVDSLFTSVTLLSRCASTAPL
jgi:hypothetical protein